MPVEAVVEAVVEVTAEAAIQVTGEIATEAIERRYGWKGCLFPFLAVAGLIALAIYFWPSGRPASKSPTHLGTSIPAGP